MLGVERKTDALGGIDDHTCPAGAQRLRVVGERGRETITFEALGTERVHEPAQLLER